MRPLMVQYSGRQVSSVDEATLPDFVYGAVYFRKSNPPPEDRERDYAVAAEDGYAYFRHWFLWSAIETAPGSTTGLTMTGNSTWPRNTAKRPSSPR